MMNSVTFPKPEQMENNNLNWHHRKFLWCQHLFWMIGNWYYLLYTFKFEELEVISRWIIIHLAGESKLVSYKPPPLKQRIKGNAMALFGLLNLSGFLYTIGKLFINIFNSI